MSPPMAVKVGLIPDEAVDHVEGALQCLAEPRAFGKRTEELGVGARRVEWEPPVPWVDMQRLGRGVLGMQHPGTANPGSLLTR